MPTLTQLCQNFHLSGVKPFNINASQLILCLVFLSLLPFTQASVAQEICPEWINQDLTKLRSTEIVNLCQLKKDRVLLIVNTASECGFTPQFKGLEALYQRYKEQGLIIIGFPSDSFFQEHDEAEKTADVCYINYGVTFPMVASSSVRGSKANSIFKHLADEKGAPKWNFYKYLIGRDGSVIDWFNSRTKPDNEILIKAIEKALKIPILAESHP